MPRKSTCPNTYELLTNSPCVLFGPPIAQKNGNDAENITDQKLHDVQRISSKEPQLWASNDVDDVLGVLSSQDLLGPNEDLLAALERMPKSVTIEAAAQTKAKAPGKASLSESREAGKGAPQGPSKGSLHGKTASPVPSKHSGQVKSAVPGSSEPEAVRKVTIQTQSKDSTPVRSAGLAPNKLLVQGVASSPTLSETLFPVKSVLPTQSKNATFDIAAVPPSSKAAAEGKPATLSMSKAADTDRTAEATQVHAGGTGKDAVLAPSNTAKTTAGSLLTSYKDTASYRSIMSTQSEADTQGRAAAWSPSKDIFSSISTSPASLRKATRRKSEGLVSGKLSETAQSKDTSNMVSTFGKYSIPALGKVEFQGLVVPETTSEAARPVKDVLPTFHKNGGQLAAAAPVSGISSIQSQKTVTTAIEAQDKAAVSGLRKFSLTGPPSVPDKGFGPVVETAPASSTDSILDGTKFDSALGKAVAFSATTDGANSRPSILSQSKSPASVKESLTSRDKDTALGVAAARAPVKVTFSTSSVQSEKTSPVKVEKTGLVKALGSSMERTPGKAEVPSKTEFSGQDKFALSSPRMAPVFAKYTVSTPGFIEGSKLPTTVEVVPTSGLEAVSSSRHALLSSIGSNLSKNTVSSTNEDADGRAALPALAKFEVKGQAAPSVPGEQSKNLLLSFASEKMPGTGTDSGRAVTQETTEHAAESKVLQPEPTKFLFSCQAISPQPTEDPIPVRDSLRQAGKDGVLGVRPKTPTRVAFSGLPEPQELTEETVRVKATWSEEDLGSVLSLETKQGKDTQEECEDSVPAERDIPQTAKDTLSQDEGQLVPVEGSISASVTATSDQIKPPVQAETRVVDISKVKSVENEFEILDIAPTSKTVMGAASFKAAQPTISENLYAVELDVFTPEVTPQDKAAASASDSFDQGSKELDMTAEDKTVQKESSSYSKGLVPAETELVARRQDSVTEPSKDYSTGEVLPPPMHEVLPASRELPAFGASTVAMPEEDFVTVETKSTTSSPSSSSNDAPDQAETEKPATSEALGPEGAAFLEQNRDAALLEAKLSRDAATQGPASEALSICLLQLL